MACAGSSISTGRVSAHELDCDREAGGSGALHPRRCGADPNVRVPGPRVRGSSPQVRGGPRRDQASVTQRGLIPAGAGQTDGGARGHGIRGAHPRGCGADGGVGDEVRGADGLIPAGAGQTNSQSQWASGTRAHPRGCGADLDLFDGSGGGPGSSPRVRGRPPPQFRRGRGNGLIPAGAGQTKLVVPDVAEATAHPRGCGADGSRVRPEPQSMGSSPRVRGRPGLGADLVVGHGLIPAGAGQTLSGRYIVPLVGLIPAGAGQTAGMRLVSRRCWAHPRGCGADACGDDA